MTVHSPPSGRAWATELPPARLRSGDGPRGSRRSAWALFLERIEMYCRGEVRGDLWERTGRERPLTIVGVGSTNGAVGISGIDITLADKAGPNLSGDP